MRNEIDVSAAGLSGQARSMGFPLTCSSCGESALDDLDVIEATTGSGVIGLNGAAARLAMAGDKVIIVAYENFNDAEARSFQPRVVLVNEKNQRL
jgi:hypothetical protein